MIIILKNKKMNQEKINLTNRKDNNSSSDILIKEKEEFKLIKNNTNYTFLIIKLEDKIIIKHKNYVVKLDINDINELFGIQIDSKENMYKYIINAFNEGKIIIKDIILNKEIILSFNNLKEKEIKLIHDYNPYNLIFFSKLTKDSFCSSPIENTFIIFNSINHNNIIYLIYSTKEKSIKCINLVENKIITEIKNAHNKFITSFKHYYDENKKIDIIMSISSDNNEIKIWNFSNWECILNLQKINKSGNLLSACFLKENNNVYIATSNFELFDDPEPIKVYDIKGNFIKQISNSKEGSILYMEIYFDKTQLINYIISCNINYVKSYNYNKNIIYHKYYDNNNSIHNSFDIYIFGNVVQLIELCNDGNIRIWDFHLNILIKKIKVDNNILSTICIWDENNIIIGIKNKGIKIIKLNNGKIINIINEKNNIIYSAKAINHPKYGKSLITQGIFCEQIRLWIN